MLNYELKNGHLQLKCSCIKHQKLNTSTSLKQSHKSKPHLFAHVMGNRYSKFIQIYKTKVIITWYTCVILFTDSSVNELYFVNFSYNKQKFLKTLIGMFQLEPTQRLRQDHKLKNQA